MNALQLAFLSISRRKIPSLIALVAIAISVACSGILYRLYYLSNSRFATMGTAGDAIVGAKAGGVEILLNSLNAEGEYPGYVPYKLYQSLQQQNIVQFEDGASEQPYYIESIIPVLFFGKLQNYRLLGTEDKFFHRPKVEDSPALQDGHLAQQLGDVVIGAQVAKKENLKIGDEVEFNPWSSEGLSQEKLKLRVVGILNPTQNTWDRTLFSTVEQAQRVLAAQNISHNSIWDANVLNYFFIYLKTPDGFTPLKNLVDRRTVAQVINVKKAKKELDQLSGTGRALGVLIAIFILALGGLSVAAMLITRFDAMTVQMAVLRAIGYSKKEITHWLLFEGLILGLSACVIGAMIDFLCFPALRATLGSALPGPDVISVSIFQSTPIWCAAIGATILAVVIPLARVYRQDIHYSLRGI